MSLYKALIGALYDCPDPVAGRELLMLALEAPAVTPMEDLVAAGLDPRLIDVLSSTLTSEERDAAGAVSLMAAGWVEGFRSSRQPQGWEPVVTAIRLSELPQGVRRATGETLISIINGTKERLGLVAPFVDQDGLSVLVPALAAATMRGVSVDLLTANENAYTESALSHLRQAVEASGDWTRVSCRVSDDRDRWPHLKLVAADGAIAYVGSANFTGRALRGRNAELGVLVRGEGVLVLEEVFRQLPSRPLRQSPSET